MLIFDIVHKLVSSFNGKDVELILLILKSKLIKRFCQKMLSPFYVCCIYSNGLLVILWVSSINGIDVDLILFVLKIK